ncbi:MAG: ribosome biogenesis GTPase YlqF [Alcanivoracaceae bacterium]|nr:ribosome biogenesis GTPase YlqF [Alcanivoracaceae bacterium]
MSINWFPGHMNKATREIREILPKVDVVIEIVDARLPYSSANPVLAQLRATKPCVKVLSKTDLADPVITRQWLEYLESDSAVRALAVSTLQPDKMRRLADICRQLPGVRPDATGNVTALITGIPNVGKSTLINTLAGRPIAKAGNEPAVTKMQQRIDLRNGLVLIDSPGVLWPRIDNPDSGYRLALSGAIKATAMQEDDVAVFAADYLLQAYPQLLRQRYKLDQLPDTGVELLEIIGRQRGCIGSGGYVDFERVSTLLINEFRAAKIGQISLETPQMAVAEEAVVRQQLEEKAAKKEAADKARRQAFKADRR